jgi:hypothetical protein
MNELHSINIDDSVFFKTNVFNGVDVFNVVFFNVIIFFCHNATINATCLQVPVFIFKTLRILR